MQKITNFFIRYYRNNSYKYIYASAFSKNLDFNIDLAYKFLEKLVETENLKRIYEFRCPTDYSRIILNTDYINLPDSIICPECDSTFITRDHIFVIYEVIKNE